MSERHETDAEQFVAELMAAYRPRRTGTDGPESDIATLSASRVGVGDSSEWRRFSRAGTDPGSVSCRCGRCPDPEPPCGPSDSMQ